MKVLIAPKNNLGEEYKDSIKDSVDLLYFIDNYKKDDDILSIKDIQKVDFDEIIIISPNYFKEIINELIKNNIPTKKIFFAIPNGFNFIKTSSILYANLLYEIYKIKINLSIYYDNFQLFLLKNKHKSKKIFLIGNGPSLKIEDLDKLKNEITFAANKIYLSYDQTDFRPTYYIVEDDLVYKQNYEQISSLKGSTKLFPSYAKIWGKPIKNGIYFKMSYMEPTSKEFPKFNPDPINGMFWGSTVVFTMIQWAIYVGSKEIYLLGIDFSFDVPKKQIVNKYNRIDLICEGEINHFHKDYRKIGEKWNLPNLEIQIKSFMKAKEYAQEHGIKIYNASRETKLDVFEKINFDKLF